ncbi:MAG: ERF family protein [Microthrixaceae bacterium]
MTEAPRSIIHRLRDVAADLPPIGKDSRMSGGGQNYNYRGIDDIMPHIRTAFAKHGVVVAPAYTIVKDETWEVAKGDRSTRWRHLTLQGQFTFHGLDGDSVTVTTLGEGKDSADKAANKAETAALKYALVQLLNIADGDDPDAYYPSEGGGASVKTALRQLVDLRPALQAANLYPEVTAFAVDNGVELVPGTPDDRVRPVLEYAQQLLAEHAAGGNGA